MTFEEFTEFYNTKGYCPGDVGRRQRLRPLNQKELQRRFDTLEKSKGRSQEKFEAKKELVDEDLDTREACRVRDGLRCRLVAKILSNAGGGGGLLHQALKAKAGPLYVQLDVAHVFGKGSHPWMRHDLDNVVLLNRYSHSMLDQGKHPIYGKPIPPDEREHWWTWILAPQVKFETLAEKAKRRP